MQPIYVVDRLEVRLLILDLAMSEEAKFHTVDSLSWGEVRDLSRLIDAVDALKRYPNGTINMSTLAQCIQSFYTPKLIGGGNCMLIKLWNNIKAKRQILPHELR